MTALSIRLEHEGATRMLEEWVDWGVDVPLELVGSPFRSITDTSRTYIGDLYADGTRTVVTCVLPELVLERWWHRLLHSQTALLIKSVLPFEPGVVTTSMPYASRGASLTSRSRPAIRRQLLRILSPRSGNADGVAPLTYGGFEMRPGAGLTLIAIGAILAFAVRVDFEGLNVPAVGVILMLTGLVGLVITFVLRQRRLEAEAEAEDAWDHGAETTHSPVDPDHSYHDDGTGY